MSTYGDRIAAYNMIRLDIVSIINIVYRSVAIVNSIQCGNWLSYYRQNLSAEDKYKHTHDAATDCLSCLAKLMGPSTVVQYYRLYRYKKSIYSVCKREKDRQNERGHRTYIIGLQQQLLRLLLG